jgi:hypothetical protein
LQKLARDPQWVGGTLPILAVLHTWTRALLLHPHAHLLVPAGGVGPEGTWVAAKHPQFLVPGYALSRIFRAKIKAGLKQLGLLDPSCPCWAQNWDVHCRHAGSGQKVLDYLARYVFRIAITNSRLEKLDHGEVTFRYRDNKTHQLRHLTLPAQEFIARFLQHVLPKGFVKVRSYGLWSATQQAQLARLQAQLAQASPARTLTRAEAKPAAAAADTQRILCPQCKLGHMVFIREVAPERKWPP